MRNTGIGRAGLLLALVLTGSAVLAPSSSAGTPSSGDVVVAPAAPTAEEIAAVGDVSALGSRNVKVRTTDGNPGGELEATITWSGSGPYKGRINGSFQDREADGYCVGAWVWYDGATRHLNPKGQNACPKNVAKPARFGYSKKWRVLVKVCLVKDNNAYHCSDWK